jgi:hypothetical protein
LNACRLASNDATLPGFATRVHAAGTTATRVTVEVCVIPPPVATIANGYEPAFTVFAIVSVSVLELAVIPPRAVGENDAVTPAANPVTDKAIRELNPFSGVCCDRDLSRVFGNRTRCCRAGRQRERRGGNRQ